MSPTTFLLRPPGKSPKSPPAFLPEKGGSLESIIGVWRSLVARFVRDEEAVGSNPATPTTKTGNTLQVHVHGNVLVHVKVQGGMKTFRA